MQPDKPPRAHPLISVVSPTFQAEEIVDELVRRITRAVETITRDFEIVLVEDRSPDGSWPAIVRNCRRDPRVVGVRLSKNFGQHKAIAAGLHCCRGEYVVVMDCDLQDNPDDIPRLYEKLLEGNDVVFTIKKARAHGMVKNLFSALFHRVFNWLMQGREPLENTIGAFSMLRRKVVDAYCQLKEDHRPYILTLHWLGFTTSHVEVMHEKRFAGTTSYTWRKLFALAMEGIFSHTTRLLHLTVYTGFFFAVAGILGILAVLFQTFVYGARPGWPSLAILIIFSTGLILTSLGVLGLYFSRMFEQIRGRPMFLIAESMNYNRGSAPGSTQTRDPVPLVP